MSGAGAVNPYTVETAPERLVYQFFFSELTAAHRAASQLAAQGKSGAHLLDRYRELLSLDRKTYSFLQETAVGAVAEARDYGRQMAELAKSARTPEERQRLAPQMLELRQRSDGALEEALLRLQARLGPEGFARLDQRIRRHVVPHLTVRTVSGANPPAEAPR
jgi:hypothetical protein